MTADELPKPVAGVVLCEDGPALVKRGHEQSFISRNGGQLLYTRAALDAVRAQERERLLSLPALLRACDAVGVPETEEYAQHIRRALDQN